MQGRRRTATKIGRSGSVVAMGFPRYNQCRDNYMDKTNLARFREILTKRREELRRGLSKDEPQDAHDFGRDEGDRAAFSQSKELAFRQKAQERGLLMQVESALSRIESGSFGECMHCGQEISLPRLNAVPWSRYCITCQELIAEQR